MTPRTNELGQPIGFAVESWRTPARPPREPMQGAYCRLEPLDLDRHSADLLDPSNFDEAGRQRRGLSDLTRPIASRGDAR